MQYSKYSWFNVWMLIHIFKAFLVKWLWPWRESRATDQPACRTQEEPGTTCMPQRPSPMFHIMWCHFMPLCVASALSAYTLAPSLPREAMGIQFWDLGWFFPRALYLFKLSLSLSSRAFLPYLRSVWCPFLLPNSSFLFPNYQAAAGQGPQECDSGVRVQLYVPAPRLRRWDMIHGARQAAVFSRV